eukprot:Hpha_TRINITY_DN15592_c0_g1::TRINITY_DN15592_c0_g1_i2::g.108735::m.108735/K01744/aspA; aspartate ammonia-lyase
MTGAHQLHPPCGAGHRATPVRSGGRGQDTRAMEVKNYTQTYGVLSMIDELSGRILDERPTEVEEYSANILFQRLEREGRASALLGLAKSVIACAERAGATRGDLESLHQALPRDRSTRTLDQGSDKASNISNTKSVDAMNDAARRRASPTSTGRKKVSQLKDGDVSREARIEALAHNEFFCRFPKEIQAECVDISSAFVLSAGAVLYKRGDLRQNLYVIVDGLIRVTEVRKDGFWDLGTFHNGHCLGETALSRPAILKHRTEAMAVNPATFLVFSVAKLSEFFAKRGLQRGLFEAAAAVSRNRMRAATHKEGGTRKERDILGDCEIPKAAYYGIRTQRAKDIFSASGVNMSRFPNLVKALCMVKKASALANQELKLLDEEKVTAICQACDEAIEGNMHDEFCIDMLQGGAGVSTMANAHEVIAN